MGLGECTIAGGGAAENGHSVVLSVKYGGAAAPRRDGDVRWRHSRSRRRGARRQ